MRHIKILSHSLILLAAMNFGFAPISALPVSVVASLKGDACAGLTQIDSGQDCSKTQDPVGSITHTTVNILSIVIGAVAIIMIIVSGFRFITSGGDSSKVASAKSALIYALIGVAIVALAQLLVHFVLSATGSDQCFTNPKISASDPRCQ